MIDCDRRNGADNTLARLTEQHGPLPPTLESETADGRHFYFTASRDLTSTTGKIGAGIDSKGSGGYVLVPPSLQPSGRLYRWLDQLEPVAPPQWLVDLACKRSNSQRAIAASGFVYRLSKIGGDNYGKAALASEVATLAATPEGARNHQLNVSAFRFFQLVAASMLSDGDVVVGFSHVCKANGLWTDDGPRQCLATIRSGAMAGAQHPREVRT